VTTPEQLLERLQAAESAATGPPAGTNDRVWGAIEDRLANGPVPPDLDDGPLLEHAPTELAANVGASSSVVLKVVGVLAVVGVIGAGLALSRDRDRRPDSDAVVERAATAALVEPAPDEPLPPEPETLQPEPAEPVPVEPAPVEPAPVEPAPVEPSLEPPSPSETSKPKPTPKAPAQPKSLADEVALMQTLSTALKQEDSSKVLALVAEHERDFQKGQFIEERRAAKARALCRSGKLAAGKREAESFASRWPDSIHLTFVNQACGLE
jgi:hypothetical protein